VQHEGETISVIGRGTVTSVEPRGAEDGGMVIGLSIEEATTFLRHRGWEPEIAKWSTGFGGDDWTVWRFRRRAH
jgi:hypothetical protein